jgi:predicted dehydrogenase
MGNIEWHPSISDALSHASAAVIAIPPLAQKRIVEQVLSISDIKKLIIEKPICPEPNASITLTSSLLATSKCFRVGYTFLYTDWYHELQQALRQPAKQLRIIWTFRADHFIRSKETWKRCHSLGGGVLRFYGIHVLAVLASLGYTNTKTSQIFMEIPDQPDTWICEFSGINLPPCTVLVATNSDQNNFDIEVYDNAGNIRFVNRETSPFSVNNATKDHDGRVPVLERLIRSLDNCDERYINLYRATNALWAMTESLQDGIY